jgi:hypothetical protein
MAQGEGQNKHKGDSKMRAPKKVIEQKRNVSVKLENEKSGVIEKQIDALNGKFDIGNYNTMASGLNQKLVDAGLGSLQVAYIDAKTMSLCSSIPFPTMEDLESVKGVCYIDTEDYELINFDGDLYEETEQAEFTNRISSNPYDTDVELEGFGTYLGIPVRAEYIITDDQSKNSFDFVDWDDALKKLYIDTNKLDEEDVDWSIKNGQFVCE